MAATKRELLKILTCRKPYAIALMAAAKRLLCREALFLWMILLSAILSMVLVELCSICTAAALSPVAMAFFTFLIAVRNEVRIPKLCSRRLSD